MPANNIPFVQFLTTTGSGSGNMQQAANFSATPTLFYAQPFPGSIYYVREISILITMQGILKINDYGNILGGLTNGIKLETRFAGNIHDSLDGQRIRRNREWEAFATTQFISYPSDALNSLIVKAGLKEFGAPLELIGRNNDYIGFRINDDLSGLTSQIACITGTLSIL